MNIKIVGVRNICFNLVCTVNFAVNLSKQHTKIFADQSDTTFSYSTKTQQSHIIWNTEYWFNIQCIRNKIDCCVFNPLKRWCTILIGTFFLSHHHVWKYQSYFFILNHSILWHNLKKKIHHKCFESTINRTNNKRAACIHFAI